MKVNSSIRFTFDTHKKDIKKIRMALNRAARDAMAAARKKIRSDWNIPLKELTDKSLIKFYPASKDNTKAIFEIKHRGVPLIKYKVKPNKVQKKRFKKQLTVEEQKGKPRQLKGAFIANTKSGLGVYTRTAKSKPIKVKSKPRVWFALPIARLFGPSAGQLYSATQTKEIIKNKFFEVLKKEYERLLRTKISSGPS